MALKSKQPILLMKIVFSLIIFAILYTGVLYKSFLIASGLTLGLGIFATLIYILLGFLGILAVFLPTNRLLLIYIIILFLAIILFTFIGIQNNLFDGLTNVLDHKNFLLLFSGVGSGVIFGIIFILFYYFFYTKEFIHKLKSIKRIHSILYSIYLFIICYLSISLILFNLQ